MEIKPDSPKSMLKSLRRKHAKHDAMLSRVDKAEARLERRRIKLQALESKIADLERRIAGPGKRKAGGVRATGARRDTPLIFNPSAGPGERDNAEELANIVRALRSHGIEARIGLKTSGKSARMLAQRAVRNHEPLLLVAAGDGTIEGVASQLVGSNTVLGIIPIGTMNNLARSLGVPLDVDEACALLGMGTVRRIDVGRVFSQDSPQVEYFLEGAGVGLSAVAAYAGQAFEKRRWSFLPRSIGKLFEHKPGKIQVQMDDTFVETESDIVTVSNSPLMGKNLLLAPEAKMDDGVLDVALYDGMNGVSLIQHFLAAGKGEADGLKTYRARQVRITSEQPIASNSDKDVVSERRVIEIGITPKALSVVAGNGIGLSFPVESAPTAPPIVGEPPSENGKVEALDPDATEASV